MTGVYARRLGRRAQLFGRRVVALQDRPRFFAIVTYRYPYNPADNRRGPLAQLVERHVYTVDVIGSSPVGPTLSFHGDNWIADGTVFGFRVVILVVVTVVAMLVALVRRSRAAPDERADHQGGQHPHEVTTIITGAILPGFVLQQRLPVSRERKT